MELGLSSACADWSAQFFKLFIGHILKSMLEVSGLWKEGGISREKSLVDLNPRPCFEAIVLMASII